MPRRPAGTRRLALTVCLLAVTGSGMVGCVSSGLGLFKPFGRGEQHEPEVEEETKPNDWRSAPSGMRNDKDQKSSEDPLDKLIWSSEARDINRSLGGAL